MNNPSPNEALVHCPHCGAWPMALAPNEVKDSRRITFKCPKCHAPAVYAVGVGGSLLLAPEEKPQRPLLPNAVAR
jgi:hypothetical protein